MGRRYERGTHVSQGTARANCATSVYTRFKPLVKYLGWRQYDTEAIANEVAESYALEVDNFWQAESSALVRHIPTQMDDPFALRQLGKPPAAIEQGLYQLYQEISTEARRWLGLNV